MSKNDEKFKIYKKRKILRVFIMLFSIATIVLAILFFVLKISIFYSIICLIIGNLLNVYRNKFKFKGSENMSKKNKKGFTLIELLAVVSILGIILVISVISINNVNKNSILKSSLASAKNYVRGVEYKLFDRDTQQITSHLINNEILNDVLDNGSYPEDGAIVVYGNKVVQANLCFNNKSMQYLDNEYTVYDDNRFCNYIDMAKINNTNGEIDTSTLTKQTAILGKEYLNPEYEEYMKLTDEQKEKLAHIPTKYISDDTKYDEVINNVIIAKNNSNNKIKNMSNKIVQMENTETLPKRFDLRNVDGKNYITSVKDQGDLGLCWAYAGINTVESALLKNKGINVDLSERQVDYFSTIDAFKEISANPYGDITDYISNGYSSDLLNSYFKRNVSDSSGISVGGNSLIFMKTLFTGLTIQTNNVFNDNEERVQQSIEKLINEDKIEYYVKAADYFTFTEYNENNVKKIKEHVKNIGPVTISVCTNTMRPGVNPNDPDEIVNIIYSNSIISNSLQFCGSHAVSIIGWDDDIKYLRDLNSYQGAWIVKNSWGTTDANANPYFYVAYDYEKMYVGEIFGVSEVEIKDWDNSYDRYNNSINTYKNLDSTTTYFNKVNNKEEYVTKIGYLLTEPVETSKDIEIEVYSTDGSKSCESTYLHSINFNQNTAEYLRFTVNNLNKGFNILELDTPFKIKDDICIEVSDSVVKDIVVFTKNANNSDNTIKLESVIETNYQQNVVVETATNNIKPGSKISYKIVNSKGTDVTDKVVISDNYVINNIVHASIKLPNSYQHNIIASYNGVISNTVVVNKGNIPSTPPIIDSTIKPTKPSCTIVGNSSLVGSSNYTYYIDCKDDDGFSDTTITKEDIKLGGILKLKVMDVSVATLTTDRKIATWRVTIKRIPLFGRGNSSIMLRKDAISDKYGAKNDVSNILGITVKVR